MKNLRKETIELLQMTQEDLNNPACVLKALKLQDAMDALKDEIEKEKPNFEIEMFKRQSSCEQEQPQSDYERCGITRTTDEDGEEKIQFDINKLFANPEESDRLLSEMNKNVDKETATKVDIKINFEELINDIIAGADTLEDDEEDEDDEEFNLDAENGCGIDGDALANVLASIFGCPKK